MKKIILIFAIIFAVLVVYLGKKTYLFENLWGFFVGKNHFIPIESSVFAFKPTLINEKYGEYWLYGEDEDYFYTTQATKENEHYTKIVKKEAVKINGFKPKEYKTWQLSESIKRRRTWREDFE